MKNFLTILIVISIFTACDGGFGSDSAEPGFGSGSSSGGSLARFAIVNDYLYVVNDMSLIPVDISDLSNPKVLEQVDIGLAIETIFPYNGNLFIGSASAVFIFSISNPANPTHLSTYRHSTGCDPVVVRGDYAYVTLREGESCGAFFPMNVLEVVNVSNPRDPRQVNSVPMSNPRGLGIGCNNKLFVCEGPGGIVQFDISNPEFPVMDTTYTTHAANDVIVNDSLLIVTGDDGLYQYSCTSESIELLSVLPISL